MYFIKTFWRRKVTDIMLKISIAIEIFIMRLIKKPFQIRKGLQFIWYEIIRS